jgi:hypothetical protein
MYGIHIHHIDTDIIHRLRQELINRERLHQEFHRGLLNQETLHQEFHLQRLLNREDNQR